MPAQVDPNATLLLIFGADREGQVARQGNQIRITGTSDIYGLLQGPEPNVPYHRLQVTPNIFRQNRIPELVQYRCLVNLITEPEGNDKVLSNLSRLLRGASGKVLNRPEAVLQSTRDQVARRLSDLPGLRVPRVARMRPANSAGLRQAIGRAGLSYPVILRQAGSHTGHIVGLIDNADRIPDGLAKGADYLATEFVDFRNADGLYRKYRVFFIGQRIVFRHLIVSDAWNIHAKDRRRFMIERPELLAEEKLLFERPEGAFPDAVIDTLRSVRDRMKLDFFGMDFAILPGGQLLLFEANASMNFFPFMSEPEFAYVQQCWAPARRAFREMLGLAAADAAGPSTETT
jgi:glutathione synthase/RimK-type ligase-like ATP-grasp enzyme